MKIFYVYAYLRENGVPYYIGKGKERRAYEQHRAKGKGVHTPIDKNKILFLYKDITEAEAFEKETELIKKYGREDLGTGVLKNRTNGGEGSSGTSQQTNFKKGASKRGKPTSEITRKKISEANKKRDYPNNHTEEVRKKLSETTKKSWEKRSRKITEEQKKKISESMKKKWNKRKERGSVTPYSGPEDEKPVTR